MKVLNLDDLAKPTKVVVIKGSEYPIEEMSVEGFIEFKQLMAKLEEKKSAGEAVGDEDYLGMMRVTVRLALPAMPMDVANGLKLVQLSKLCDFINDNLEEGEQQGAAAIQAGEEGDAKKS